ncbi:MAG: PEP-utilizing enzyme, partial [bacterium]
LRQCGVEYFSMYSVYLMKHLKAIAKKIGVSYEELLDLTTEEIINGINGTDVKNIIEKRRDDRWLVVSVPGEKSKVIDDPRVVEQLISTMIPKAKTSDAGSIVGQIGNKGIGRGTVKVILSPQNSAKMQKGDVLVTTMTTPDFVPLMQKASAIVTDIGGLLCHAAIISRELNIPCVIGTKFATHLLKDGDKVEVDANKGIVKIIK